MPKQRHIPVCPDSLTLEELKAKMLSRIMTPAQRKAKKRQSALKGWETYRKKKIKDNQV